MARKASRSSLSWPLMPSRAEASRALLAMRFGCLSLRTLSALGLGRSEGARRPFLDGGRWVRGAQAEGQYMRPSNLRGVEKSQRTFAGMLVKECEASG